MNRVKHLSQLFTAVPLATAGIAIAGSEGTEPIIETSTPAAEEATLFPVPNLGGDIWTRDVMTGDWGGTRQRLADRGIQFEIDVQQYYQGLADGGVDEHWDYNGTSDYRLKIDTGKAGWWPGGFIEIHGETYWGNGQTARDGSFLPTNTDYLMKLPKDDGTYLSHVVITQFLSEEFAVVFGKLDTTVGDANAFAHGVGTDKFMNLAFSFNPVTILSAPYSTLGAGVVWLPNENVVASFSAYDVEGDLEESGFDTVFEGGTGYNAEVRVTTDFFGKPGHHLFGATYADGGFSVLSDNRLLIPELPGVPEVVNSTWNAYYNFDQYIHYDEETGAGWGVFGRVGFADKRTNPIDLFLSAGVGGTGLIPSRPDDRFGFGYFYAHLTDELPSLAKPLVRDEEHGIELFYDMAVTQWFRLAADLQIISPSLKSADTATIVGVRSKISF